MGVRLLIWFVAWLSIISYAPAQMYVGGGEATIIVFTGQSNNKASGTNPASIPANIQNLGFLAQIWNTNTSKFELYNPGVNSDTSVEGVTNPQHYGPEGEFLRQHIASHGLPAYIVKHPPGGTALADAANEWTPNGGGGVAFNAFKTQLAAAKSFLTALRKVVVVGGVIWIHGETDGQNSAFAAAYATNLTNFIAVMRASPFGTASTKFILNRMSCDITNCPNRVDVRTAQTAAGGFNTDDLGTDGLHYTAPAIATVGSRAFALY